MGNTPHISVDPDGGLAGPGLGLLWKWVANPTTVNNLAGYVTRTVLGNILNIGSQLVGPIAMNLLRQTTSSWLDYNGTEIKAYEGPFGNTSKMVDSWKATSGFANDKVDFRNSAYQKVVDAGPVPEGNYSVNLVPDPNRETKFGMSEHGVTSLNNEEGGIETIPERVSLGGKRYSPREVWGNYRARLDPMKGTNTNGRKNFYLHDSKKGYSHGCIECEGGLFSFLFKYRKIHGRIIVRIKYPGKTSSTYGRTDIKD